MYTPIKFIYALLIITIIGGGITVGIIKFAFVRTDTITSSPERTNISLSQKNPRTMVGVWNWEYYDDEDRYSKGVPYSTFRLEISTNVENEVSGTWLAVAEYGNRIDACGSSDYDKDCMVGTLSNNVANVSYKNGYGLGEGKAKITYDPIHDSLSWEIIQKPKDDSYIPMKAILNRKVVVVQKTKLEQSSFFAAHPGAYTSFKELVGDALPEFESTVGTESSDTDSILRADIGLFTVQKEDEKLAENVASIILIVPGNKIWAAIIYRSGSGAIVQLHYYTNVPEWEHKLPQSIKKWEWMKKVGKIEYVSLIENEEEVKNIEQTTQGKYMEYEADAESKSLKTLKKDIPDLIENLATQYKEDPKYEWSWSISLNIDAYLDVYEKRAPNDKAFVDKIRNSLLVTYGPCMGIPEGRCKE